MSKSIILVLSIMLFGLTAFTQETVVTDSKTNCIPAEECAAKMGMTLEECKAVCKKLCKESDTRSGTGVSPATADLNTESVAGTQKACCVSVKKGAAKKGMTIETCKAKCISSEKTASIVGESSTKGAAASVEAIVDTKEMVKTKWAKGDKKCCKK